MPQNKTIALFLVLTMSIMLSGQYAFAESSTTSGDYTIHYNALQTDILEPEIAKSYGIKRSTKRGILNIAVRKNQSANSLGEPAEADVSANWSNLNGQMGQIAMREIREKDAIYYIGEFAVRHAETLTFNLVVTIKDDGQVRNISFRRQFIVD